MAVQAALTVPKQTPAMAVMLVHEWPDLNDQIKSMATELAKQGYPPSAIDLYRGKVATDPGQARKLMGDVDYAAAAKTIGSELRRLKRDDMANGKVAAVGWCFGCGWSLNAWLAEPVNTTIVYYGNVKKSAGDLNPLHGPILVHFAECDKWSNRDMVSGSEVAMEKIVTLLPVTGNRKINCAPTQPAVAITMMTQRASGAAVWIFCAKICHNSLLRSSAQRAS